MPKRLALLLTFLLISFSVASETAPTIPPIRLDRDGEKWVQKTLRKMSLEEKVGQMLMVWARAEFLNVNSPEFQRYRDMLHRYHLGSFGLTVAAEGPFLYRNQPYEAAMLTNMLQRESELPLLFAADFERGLMMRLNGTTGFPHAMAFGAARDPKLSEESGRITAMEARAIGVHWNFYPDTDVNSNPSNPIINTRSFSEDPAQVGQLATAYIKGAHDGGIMTTAKHFPGHGDTDTDSHLALARVNGDLERLNKIELAPFRDAINAGVDSVMIAHVTVPALEPDPNRVASISQNVVEKLLRQDLQFQGIIVTDAMDMNALMRLFPAPTPAAASGRATVEAVKAGNDMILIPADLDGAYNGLLQAVRSGEIPESRIDRSVLRILRAKAALGLHRNRTVDLNALSLLVARPESLATAQKVADEAVTLVRDNGQVLPLVKSNGTTASHLTYQTSEEIRNRVLAVILTDDVRADSGRVFERQLRLRVPDANIVWVDGRSAAALTPQILQAAGEAQKVIAAVYVIPSAGRTTKGTRPGMVEDASSALLSALVRHMAQKTTIVALGNPYVAADYGEVQNYLCTFSNAPVSEISAVKALFGEIPVHGRLPVTIPGVAERGFGLDRPTGPRQ